MNIKTLGIVLKFEEEEDLEKFIAENEDEDGLIDITKIITKVAITEDMLITAMKKSSSTKK